MLREPKFLFVLNPLFPLGNLFLIHKTKIPFLFSLILFLVMGVFRLIQAAGNSLVERLRHHPEEEAHNIPEEVVVPQVFICSNFSKMLRKISEIVPVVSLVFI